jgi:hypothetical protein
MLREEKVHEERMIGLKFFSIGRKDIDGSKKINVTKKSSRVVFFKNKT